MSPIWYIIYLYAAAPVIAVLWLWTLKRASDISYREGRIKGCQDAAQFWRAVIKARDLFYRGCIRRAQLTGEVMNVREITYRN